MRTSLWLVLTVLGSLMVTSVQGAPNTKPPPPKKPAPPAPHPHHHNDNNAWQQAYMQALQNYYRQLQYQSALARLYYLGQMYQSRGTPNAGRTNPAMMNAYGRAMARMYANALNGMNAAANGYTDYVCVPIDDVTVRRYRLPPKDPTDPKAKYTAEELKELKGEDAKLIGYTAKYEELRIGQTVRVTMCRKRVDPKDPDKVTYITLNTMTGTLQKLDENSSMKEFVVRVRGNINPQQQQQRRNNNNGNNNNGNNNNNNITLVPADPDKCATMIVIYSDEAAGNPLAGNN
jgi:hypothetical protein